MSGTQTTPRKMPRIRKTALVKAVTDPDKTPDKLKLSYTLENMVKLKMTGLTYEQIGEYYGVCKQTIHDKIQGIWAKLDPEKLAVYRANRVTALEAVEEEVLSQLVSNGKLEKASANNLGYVLSQVHQARRLEAGESTSNVALHGILERIELEEARRRQDPQDVVIGQDPSDAEQHET